MKKSINIGLTISLIILTTTFIIHLIQDDSQKKEVLRDPLNGWLQIQVEVAIEETKLWKEAYMTLKKEKDKPPVITVGNTDKNSDIPYFTKDQGKEDLPLTLADTDDPNWDGLYFKKDPNIYTFPEYADMLKAKNLKIKFCKYCGEEITK